LKIPAQEAPPYVFMRTVAPEDGSRRGDLCRGRLREGRRGFHQWRPHVAGNHPRKLNDLGRDNGIGRLDLVENRFVGMKSRGIYETPGGTILLAAHRAMESLTLDREAAHLKDSIMPRYAELIYYGFWFSPEREMLQALIDKSQEHVEGTVTLKLYKGNVIVVGRSSAKSRSTPTRSSPSRTIAAPTTRKTRPASSS
jgi:argininosuccinate synthase